VPVVMGGPHVTEVPGETLGRDGGPRHADSVALGEADETWPRIVEDAAAGRLKEIYRPVDAFGQERKPDLQNYPEIPWESIDIAQFNRIPGFFRSIMAHYHQPWETFHRIPIESGRGCPYGCDFCTVTGFFGDSIRYRSNQSIVNEMLRLKARAQRTQGKIAVFFEGFEREAVAGARLRLCAVVSGVGGIVMVKAELVLRSSSDVSTGANSESPRSLQPAIHYCQQVPTPN
jgi:hypothetical protein